MSSIPSMQQFRINAKKLGVSRVAEAHELAASGFSYQKAKEIVLRDAYISKKSARDVQMFARDLVRFSRSLVKQNLQPEARINGMFCIPEPNIYGFPGFYAQYSPMFPLPAQKA